MMTNRKKQTAENIVFTFKNKVLLHLRGIGWI